MPTNQPSGAVVVGLDGSEQSLTALDWAVEAAGLERRPLHLLHAKGAHGTDAERVLAAARSRATRIDPSVRVSTELVSGAASDALVAASGSAAMVCVGSHGASGFRPGILGSTATAVLSTGRCPVAVVPVPSLGGERARRIVVAVDESAGSHEAIGFGFAQANLREAPLTAVHAWHGSDRTGLRSAFTPSDRWQTLVGSEEAALAESLAGWAQKYPDVIVRRISIRRSTADAVLTVAGDAAMTVLGARRPRPHPDLAGSPVARRVLHGASCPVVVVPQAMAEQTEPGPSS